MALNADQSVFTIEMMYINWLFYALGQLCLWPSILSFDYCDPMLCHGPERHIACNNFGELHDSCSPDAHIVRITDVRRELILNELNGYRNKIAEGKFKDFHPAARMATLQWDQELASLAQLNVKRCDASADYCRNSQQFPNVAQLVAEGGWQGAPHTDDTTVAEVSVEYHTEDEVIQATLEEMFEEYKECGMQDILAFSKPAKSKCVEYFTQLIRDSATYVGCGILRETRNTTNDEGQWLLKTNQYMTCNFVRSSEVNKPVYESGKSAASGCLTGHHPTFLNLCSTAETYSKTERD